jgi:hypothetical protein
VGLTNRACSEFARRASAMPCPKGESQGEGVVIQPHTSRGQILPSRSRMTRMVRTTPNPPVGAYPQFRLCGQVGSAPINIRTSRITKTVPNIYFLSKSDYDLVS